MIDGRGPGCVPRTVKAFLFALFVATSVAAQPVVGPEVSSPPIAGLTDYALAPLRDGYFLAWAQEGHLYAGRLDSTLHLTATPADIPLSTPSSEARSLTVATNGTSALLAWNEDNPPFHVTYAATVRTDTPVVLAGPLVVSYFATPPAAGVRNGEYEVATGNQLLIMNDRLVTESTTIIDPFVSAAETNTGDLGTATLTATVTCSHGFFATCSTTDTYTLSSSTFHRSFDLQARFYDPTYSPLLRDPVVAADGDHFVGLLAKRDETRVIEMTPAIPSGDWALPVLPNALLIALAGNGKDVLLVSWNGNLNGQLLEVYNPVPPTFLIAPGGVHAPKAFATSSSEFVVTYTYEVPGGTVLAGRKIELQPSRQRAAR